MAHPIFFRLGLWSTYLALPSLKKCVTLILIINVSITKANPLGFRTEYHVNQSNHNRASSTKVVLIYGSNTNFFFIFYIFFNFASQNSSTWQPKKLKLQMELTVCNCSVSRKSTTCCGAPSGSIPCHMRERVELLKLWLACDSWGLSFS